MSRRVAALAAAVAVLLAAGTATAAEPVADHLDPAFLESIDDAQSTGR